MAAPPALVIDATFAAVLVSLQLAMLGATAWLAVDRIRLEHRLTRLEGAVESHEKLFGSYEHIRGLGAGEGPQRKDKGRSKNRP